MTNDSKLKTILAIDTSCDETSVAITYGTRILSNVISSQIELHRKWGGVVPGIARREHEERIDKVVAEALYRGIVNFKRGLKVGTSGLGNELKIKNEKLKIWGEIKLNKTKLLQDKEYLGRLLGPIDAIAVTVGPGLAIALEVGVRKAKELALEFNKSLIPVNHMEGHLLSALAERRNSQAPITKKQINHKYQMSNDQEKDNALTNKETNKLINSLFPALGVLASGGHTQLIKVNGVGEYEIIGETLDDAIGEAFDKAAAILELGYPGGPIVEDLAKNGDPDKYNFPLSMKGSGDLNVSYSGLKTAFLYKVRDLRGEERVQKNKKGTSWQRRLEMKNERLKIKGKYASINKLTSKQTNDLCASFQRAAIATLTYKIRKALREKNYKSVLLGGGVVNNVSFRNEVRKVSGEIPVLFPYDDKIFMDNAAMIGVAGFLRQDLAIEERKEIGKIDRDPGLFL